MKSRRLPFYFLPLLAFLAACTSRPALRFEEPLRVEDRPFSEETYAAMDLVIQRVKRNGGDIKKYFLLDGDYTNCAGKRSKNRKGCTGLSGTGR
jgi:hypothetical protein